MSCDDVQSVAFYIITSSIAFGLAAILEALLHLLHGYFGHSPSSCDDVQSVALLFTSSQVQTHLVTLNHYAKLVVRLLKVINGLAKGQYSVRR